jgi:hypothetical protein
LFDRQRLPENRNILVPFACPKIKWSHEHRSRKRRRKQFISSLNEAFRGFSHSVAEKSGSAAAFVLHCLLYRANDIHAGTLTRFAEHAAQVPHLPRLAVNTVVSRRLVVDSHLRPELEEILQRWTMRPLNYSCLAETKRKYEADKFFQMNQNI